MRAALRLRPVPAAGGLRWVGDGWRLFKRRPVALTLTLASFMLVLVALMMLPWAIGVPLVLMSPPLLSLGMMIAGQSALLDGPVHPRQFLEPLRGDRRRRAAILTLCGLYGLIVVLAAAFCFWLGDDATRQFAAVLSGREPGADDPRRMAEIAALPGMRSAVWCFNVVMLLISVPFWHAPALVHWGSQGVAQALFSSTLALWRTKAAFTLYGLAWAGISVVVGSVASVLLAVLGVGAFGALLPMCVMLAAWAVFHMSVLFTFNDSFGGATPPAAEISPPA